MITLRPTGGLCNRMLAIDSAIKICQSAGTDLKIHWVKNHYLNASFFDLFEPIQVEGIDLYFEETDKKELLYSDRELPHLKQRIYNSILKNYQLLYFNRVFHTYETKELVSNNYDFEAIGKSQNLLITSWSRLIAGSIDKKKFVPAKSIQSLLSQIIKQFSTHPVGIHIRRSDHQDAILRSPTSLFIDKMHQEITENPDTLFFVASDSQQEKEMLKSTFGELIITADLGNGDRNSASGMQMAMVDLYCLASTNKIYGSFASTFSSVASELNDVPFEEISVNIKH